MRPSTLRTIGNSLRTQTRFLSIRAQLRNVSVPHTPLRICQPRHSALFSAAPSRRSYSDAAAVLEAVEAPEHLTEGEKKVFDIVKDGLEPERLDVQDISGGCGSMYALDITSKKFAGLSVIKQHRLVNQVLGEEIKRWHGVQLKTRAS